MRSAIIGLWFIGSLVACDDTKEAGSGKIAVQLQAVASGSLTADELTVFQLKIAEINSHSGFDSSGSYINSRMIYQNTNCEGDDCYFDLIDPLTANNKLETDALPFELWTGPGEVPDADYEYRDELQALYDR